MSSEQFGVTLSAVTPEIYIPEGECAKVCVSAPELAGDYWVKHPGAVMFEILEGPCGRGRDLSEAVFRAPGHKPLFLLEGKAVAVYPCDRVPAPGECGSLDLPDPAQQCGGQEGPVARSWEPRERGALTPPEPLIHGNEESIC